MIVDVWKCDSSKMTPQLWKLNSNRFYNLKFIYIIIFVCFILYSTLSESITWIIVRHHPLLLFVALRTLKKQRINVK